MQAPLRISELLSRCRAGDEEAWRVLVEHYSRYVYAIAVQGFRLPEPDAEDVFQECFARVYENLEKLRDDQAFQPWLAQLTRRLCIDRVRAGGREQPAEPVDEGAVDETLATLDEALSMHEALGALSDDCQEILDRFFARDQSYRTIGEALDIPAGTIASRISRCLAKLKTTLTEENGPEERLES